MLDGDKFLMCYNLNYISETFNITIQSVLGQS